MKNQDYWTHINDLITELLSNTEVRDKTPKQCQPFPVKVYLEQNNKPSVLQECIIHSQGRNRIINDAFHDAKNFMKL